MAYLDLWYMEKETVRTRVMLASGDHTPAVPHQLVLGQWMTTADERTSIKAVQTFGPVGMQQAISEGFELIAGLSSGAVHGQRTEEGVRTPGGATLRNREGTRRHEREGSSDIMVETHGGKGREKTAGARSDLGSIALSPALRLLAAQQGLGHIVGVGSGLGHTGYR